LPEDGQSIVRTENDVLYFIVFQIAGLRHHHHVGAESADSIFKRCLIRRGGIELLVPGKQRAIENEIALRQPMVGGYQLIPGLTHLRPASAC
jgi:hypothetical protein